MTVQQWVTTPIGILMLGFFPACYIALTVIERRNRAKQQARRNHPTAIVVDNDDDGWVR